jgi:hypothetical protein
MTEGRQPFTAEITTLAKGPSTYDPLENGIRRLPSSRSLVYVHIRNAELYLDRGTQWRHCYHGRDPLTKKRWVDRSAEDKPIV